MSEQGRPRTRPEASYFKGNIFIEVPMPLRDELGDLTGYEWKKTDLIKLLQDLPCEYSPFTEAEGYHFSSEEAEVVCNFIINECVFPEGPLTGKPFIPERWQWAIYLNTYCWFEDDHPDVRRFNEVFVYVPRKNGKLQKLGTLIPTRQGWTTIGDIQVGEDVFDYTGQPYKVTHVHPIDPSPVSYEVIFSNGETGKFCADHNWFIHSRKQHPKYSNKTAKVPRKKGIKTVTNSIGRDLYEDVWTTQELFDTGVDCSYGKTFRVPMHNGLELPEVNLPIDPYILGSWLGDGSSSGGLFTVGCGDLKDHPISFSSITQEKGKNCSSCRIEGLTSLLRQNNLLNNKHIPREYLRSSRSQRLALLQGLMDTDGSIGKRGTQIEFIQKNEAIVDGLCELLASLGLKYKRSMKERSGFGITANYHFVQFSAYRDTHPAFRLQRKLNRQRVSTDTKSSRSRNCHIVSITPCDPEPMRCITVNSPSGTYLFGKTMLPTHNTSAFGAIPSLISLYVDPEKRSQNFCCAADVEQAALNFRHAAYMVEQNPKLLNKLTQGRVRHGSRYMEHNNGRTLKVLSSIADTKHGLSPNYVGVDEVHAHSNRELIDVMVTGTAARRSPLIFYTTTADYDRPSVCNDLYKRSKAVAQGLQSDPNLLPVIYEALPSDDWENPEVWEKANPNFRVSVNEKYFTKEINRVRNSPKLLNRFLRLHLNIKTSVETSWIYPHVWSATNPTFPSSELLSPEEIRYQMKLYPDWFSIVNTDQWDASFIDIHLKHYSQYFTWFFKKIIDLQEAPCFAAYDNAAVKDIASLSLFFPETHDLLSFNWVPTESIEKRSVEDGIPYQTWFNCGLVNNTPQTTIDEDHVVKAMIGYEGTGILHHFQDLRMVAFDNWGSNYISNQLTNNGLRCRAYPQSFSGMNQPCKTMESWLEQQNLFHGGNPVLTWMIGNTMLAQNNNDQVRPDRKNSTDKIDGIVSSLMSIGAWLYDEDKVINHIAGLMSEED